MPKVGAKGVEIAAELGHPKTTLYIVIKRFESHGTIEGKKLTGCPRKLLECSCRVVTCALVANRRQTLEDISNQSSFDVSHWTIRRALHKSGFYKKIA